ncbi:uncharacterized protein LOC128245037 isoform X2 [Mya arenaria]|uniref:uncharacterized protein LOC128245037 isoform X2 n=1 Tax=Mya arenaria TaxID=6604 RepID=UPI0022E93F30|nr:uncharacterized protein LOC128245037 isoform X2 [Mya arenaria]
MDARTREMSARRCVLRAYGAVSLTQLCLGLLLIISGMLALKYTQDEFHISRPPYFLGAFLVGIIIICGGICSLYVFITEAPLLDYYYLDPPSANKIKRAVTGNTVTSVLSLIGCLLGLLVCVVFAVGPCDTDMWFSKCSFTQNKTEHRALAIFITVFLCSSTILSVYASLMSCIHGWVFDFGASAVQMRRRKSHEDGDDAARPVSGFQPVPVFDIDENNFPHDDDMPTSNKYSNATSSFKRPREERTGTYQGDHVTFGDDHVAALKHHIQSQQPQPQQYVAVLNDPAMKQILKERNSRLQET